MRRIKKVSVAAGAALAALTATSLLPPAADAVIGQVRATGDTRQTPVTNNAASRGKSGPNLTVNPADSNHIVSLTQELETEECEFNRSSDGGTSWTGGGELQAPAGFPTSNPGPCDVTGHGAGNIGQRSIEFGSGNNVYAVWTSTRSLGVAGFSVLLSKSTDGGTTFPTAIEIPTMAGGVAPAADYYRPELTVERRSATTDRLIVASRNNRTSEVVIAISNDAGGTFSTPVNASNNNPIANPAPVFNGDNSAITTPGNAFIRTNQGEVTAPVLGPQPSGPAGGYRIVGADGAVFAFGNAGNFGGLAGTPLAKPIVGSATTSTGNGYFMVASDGGIFAFGDAVFRGSTGNIALNKPIVGMALTASNQGYWLVASDGGIFAYGDAVFKGSTGGIPLNKPIVGMAPTPSGQGYWLVASDGGIFAFGDATFKGSTGNIALNKPIVGMAATKSGQGYWLVASDGGIFAFGDAAFFGSTGNITLAKPIVGLQTSPTGQGYNIVASDGGVFSFGDAAFFGSTGATSLAAPIVTLSPSNKAGGQRPIYIAWNAPKNSGACPPSCEEIGQNATDGYLVVAKSLDNGLTWTRSRAINVRGFTAPFGTLFGGSNFPRLAIGPNGDLYMTWNQGPGVPGSNNCGVGPFPATAPGAAGVITCPSYGATGFKQADHFMNWDMDVFFMRSTDQGATWGNLRQLNEPKKGDLAAAEVTQTRHPEIIVSPDGRVDIAWEDRRHWFLGTSDRKNALTPNSSITANQTALGNYACVHSHSNCPEARLGDTYYSYSSDSGVNFTFNKRLNDRSHNNDVGQDYRFSTYWDYGPAIAELGNERLLVADMDARFGNVDNDSLDIVVRKVDLNAAAGAVPTSNIVNGGAADFSVALSQNTYPGGGEGVHGEGFTSRPWARPVIVNEADMPAALAGGVLARANLGPLLASPAAGLPANVQAEVDRLDPVGAYVIGDTTKLSATVEANLATAGVPAGQIVRIGGATPADIAANIALTLDRRRAPDKTATPPLPAFDAVIIANPNSASAASASALAANRRLPILYSDQGTIPAVTINAMATLNVTRAIIVGSTGVIGNRVINVAARPIPNSTSPILPSGGSTTAGSTTINTTSATFVAGAAPGGDVGRGITGPNIPAGTTITAVLSPTAATLSAAATATGPTCTPTAPATQCSPAPFVIAGAAGGTAARNITNGPRPFVDANGVPTTPTPTGGATTAGSATFTTTSPTFNLGDGDVGLTVTGPNIPAGTTIVSVQSATSATLSAAATATGPTCTPAAPENQCTPGPFSIAARTGALSSTAGQVTRLSGANQLATSAAVVQESLNRGVPRNIVYAADGNEPMHAAILGASVGRIGGLLILSTGGTAANAESTLSAAPLNLRPFVDRIVTSDLTGTAVVGNDPA